MPKIYRQGDVLLKQIDKLPGGITKKDDLVVKEGEATGHKHEFVGEGVALYLADTRLYAEVAVPVPIIHPDHEKIIIDPGVYEIGDEREYDYYENDFRKVVD